MQHSSDKFSLSSGPHPSGEGELIYLHRTDIDDPEKTCKPFSLDAHELEILIGYLKGIGKIL